MASNNVIGNLEGTNTELGSDTAKIFVGGLSWETTVDDMWNYFEHFGQVIDCNIKEDHMTGQPRGFGFVSFADSSAVDLVLSQRDHILNGKNIEPKRVKYKSDLETLRKIFVGGLDVHITEQAIREYFSQFGMIDEIDLPYNRDTNERKRFCFIRFTSNDPIERLCSTPKHVIAGSQVEVKRALNKDELASQGGSSFLSSYVRGSGARIGGRGQRGSGRGVNLLQTPVNYGLGPSASSYGTTAFSYATDRLAYSADQYGCQTGQYGYTANNSGYNYSGSQVPAVTGYQGEAAAWYNTYNGQQSRPSPVNRISRAGSSSRTATFNAASAAVSRGRGDGLTAGSYAPTSVNLRYQPYGR